MIYRNITDSQQDNWRNQHNYKETTPPWELLPYQCRIDWTWDGTDILKESSLAYISSQPDNNTYYSDGSSDGTRVAGEVVHKKEEIIIRLHDSSSVLDAEMPAIDISLEETGDKITIHTYSTKQLNNRTLELNTTTKAIRDADEQKDQLFTGYPPILEYRITGRQKRLQREA